jgi:hypothetical protein
VHGHIEQDTRGAHGDAGVLKLRYKDDNGTDAVASGFPALKLALASGFGQRTMGGRTEVADSFNSGYMKSE